MAQQRCGLAQGTMPSWKVTASTPHKPGCGPGACCDANGVCTSNLNDEKCRRIVDGKLNLNYFSNIKSVSDRIPDSQSPGWVPEQEPFFARSYMAMPKSQPSQADTYLGTQSQCAQKCLEENAKTKACFGFQMLPPVSEMEACRIIRSDIIPVTAGGVPVYLYKELAKPTHQCGYSDGQGNTTDSVMQGCPGNNCCTADGMCVHPDSADGRRKCSAKANKNHAFDGPLVHDPNWKCGYLDGQNPVGQPKGRCSLQGACCSRRGLCQNPTSDGKCAEDSGHNAAYNYTPAPVVLKVPARENTVGSQTLTRLGVNYPGNKITTFRDVKNSDDCKFECGRVPKCVGYLYKNDPSNSKHKQCLLKSALSPNPRSVNSKYEFTIMDAAITPQWHSSSHSGYDLVSSSREINIQNVGSVDSCRLRCIGDRTCVGFTYNGKTGQCKLVHPPFTAKKAMNGETVAYSLGPWHHKPPAP